jgi:NAD(P)-dependent dehydrogenase (short-subunit alcohol dehydrogenase family)
MGSETRNLFDLTGKVAVVTGGNRGIGLGMARGLARSGAAISVWARDEARNESAAEELATLGTEVQTISCDVSSERAVEEATQATLDRFGRVDIGIANAGFGAGADSLKLKLDEWHRVLAVNLDGVFLTLRELGKHMAGRKGGGKLIAISSISAQHGTPLQPHYAASKGGVESMVRSFAVRLAKYDIQVNAVEPGWIVTEATEPGFANEKLNAAIVRRTPARRWGQPEDMEGIAIYLGSDASRFHTGDTLRVDGGYAIF